MYKGERHRLVGPDDWENVAEIWQYTDVENPSDENDFIRVQNDFGRSQLVIVTCSTNYDFFLIQLSAVLQFARSTS